MHLCFCYLCSEFAFVFKTEKTINIDTNDWYLLIMGG